MHILVWTLFLLAWFVATTTAGAGGEELPLYEEAVADSEPGRVEQAQELEGYLTAMREEPSARTVLFTPDYTSPEAYEASTRRLRQALRDSLGYPPPGLPDDETTLFRKVGEDHVAIYYRTRISVLPGVHAIGLFIAPRGRPERMPLVIAMHGGGGSPELATFGDGANYKDMVRGAVARGYVVWAPQHLFQADGVSADIRNRMDGRARLVGTTLTAIEIAKITRGLNIVMRQAEIDRSRVAMIGLSYGGFYTLLTTALEPRIKVAVSSCIFGARIGLLDSAEPHGWSDWRFTNGAYLQDPQIAALICPRPLEVQMGVEDELIPIEPARRAAPEAAETYRQLGVPERFRFVEFEGGHEFHGASAWEFLAHHL